MGTQKIMLTKGQDPLKMSFTEPRPNPIKGCLIGLGVVCMGMCCVVSTLLAMGVIKWPF